MNETRPILIVGAGPTGLAAALELARFGVPVRLIDKYTAPAETSRAIAIQSRTVELMQQRGLAQEMLRLGNKGFSTRLYDGEKQLGKVDLSHIDSRFNFVLLLPQSETERILREHLERFGVRVESNTELVAFSQTEGESSSVQATLRRISGELEEAQVAYLVDAEGAHSTVRHSMDLAFLGNSLPNTYAIADLFLDGNVPEDELTIFIPKSGLLAAFPMGNRRFRIIVTEKQAVGDDALAPSLNNIQDAWNERAHIAARFRDLKWSSRFRINSRALQQLRHGRIFFAADSAHIHSPAGGQGMNTGIQDVINLGWKLAMVYLGKANADLLDTYSEERLPIIHQLVSTTEQATDVVNSDSHFIHTLLRHVMPIAFSFEAIKRKGARVVSELDANYRKSSINCGTKVRGTLHARDRFPDLPIGEDGMLRILDILDPSRFTVLLIETAHPQEVQQSSRNEELWVEKLIANPSATLLAALGDAKAAVVRPDGYVLCTGDRTTVQDQLDHWFTQWQATVPARTK